MAIPTCPVCGSTRTQWVGLNLHCLVCDSHTQVHPDGPVPGSEDQYRNVPGSPANEASEVLYADVEVT